MNAEQRRQSLIEAAIDGTLSDEQREELESLISPADLDSLIENENRLSHLLSESVPDRFDPYFEQRVMRRIESDNELWFGISADSMNFVFRRLAVPALAACVILAAHNTTLHNELGIAGSMLEAAFGLPSADPLSELGAFRE